MRNTGIAVVIVGSVVLAAWLAAAGALGVGQAPPAPPPVRPRADPLIARIQSQAARLHAYLAEPPPMAPIRRNPFRFGAARAAGGALTGTGAPSPARAGSDTTMAEESAAGATLALAGIAEDAGPGGPTRTAIIAGLDQLFLVKEGATFAGRFMVTAIGRETATVVDRTAGTTMTLRLGRGK